jgi:GNAT superfamily N-acetyltransferase
MKVRLIDSAKDVTPGQLEGFFEGWPDPPSPERHLEALRSSSHVVLAVDEKDDVIGFISAVSDGVLSAYIPLLEVRPEWRGQGIGADLLAMMLERLSGCYMIDVVCDEDVLPFYERQGFVRWSAAIRRNHDALQSLTNR